MGLTLITAATTLPVTLAEAKAHCGVEDGAHDAVLNALLKSACAWVGTQLDRALGEATWLLTLDTFSDWIELPRGPVTAITAFSYLDPAGAQQTVDSSRYTVDLTSTPQGLARNSDEVWPEVLDAVNAVAVEFTAGWDADTLPQELRLAVLRCVAVQFNDRGAAFPDVSELTEAYQSLWIAA